MEIALSREAWHYKLQDRMFGPVYFQNFCPYFWLTIFCLFASPFYFTAIGIRNLFWAIVLTIGGSGWIFVKAYEWLSDWFNSGADNTFGFLDIQFCQPVDNATVPWISDERVLELYNESRYCYMHKGETEEDGVKRMLTHSGSRALRLVAAHNDKKFQTWKNNFGPEWKAELKAIDKRVTARQKVFDKAYADHLLAKAEALKLAEKRRKKMLNFLVTITPVIVKVIAVVIALFVLYGLYLVPWAVVSSLVWMIVKVLGQTLVGVVLWVLAIPKHIWGGITHVNRHFSWPVFFAVCAIAAVVVGVVKVVKKCDIEPYRNLLRAFVRFMDWVGDILEACLAPFNEFFKFVKEYVILFKKDYCPHIRWEE